jgi:hypothetical protein
LEPKSGHRQQENVAQLNAEIRPILLNATEAASQLNPSRAMCPLPSSHRKYNKNGLDLRWNAVSVQAAITAGSALERIIIPPEGIDRISELVSPGSSLIISDEGISSETANDTDFVIVMSGEPQGGIKTRRRNPDAVYQVQ